METQQGVGNTGISTFLSFGAKTVQPEILEKMLVGRQKTVGLLEQYVREIAYNGANQQVFIVGPRGSGKTHLLRVLYYRIHDMVQQRLVMVAYFAEEEYGIASYLDFLIRIINAFMRWYDGDRAALEAKLNILRETPDRRQEYLAETIISEYIGDKPLLILSENFDAILEALNKKGQDKLRAWLYRHNRISIIATSQAMSPDMGREDRPFYGFFSTIKLEKLTYEESLELLQTLAQIEQRQAMIDHLAGPGKAQVRAVYELVKGNHRLLVTFYEFLKADSVAELSVIFIKTMNDLKPYYETFIRFLPPQQQKILYYLALAKIPQKGTAIAKNCFIATTSLTKQLSELQRQHLIDALPDPDDKRNKLYDVSEPLLRIAIEIGEQREGITALFIDFLALYYSDEELNAQKRHFEARYLAESEAIVKQKLFYETEARSRAIEHKKQLQSIFRDSQERSTDGNSLGQEVSEAQIDKVYNYLFVLGSEQSKKRQYKEAIETYQKALSLKPDDADTWNNLGIAYGSQGQHQQAVEAFQKALVLEPNYAGTSYNLGIAYGSQGKYEEAIKAYQETLVLEPNHTGAWNNLGISYRYQQQFAKALEVYQKVLAIKPDDVDAWNNLGTVYDHQWQYGQAVEAYQKALSLKPDYVDVWNNLGIAYDKQGRYRQAIKAYKKALLIEPDYIDVWYNLGVAYENDGQCEQAIGAYQNAYILDPSDKYTVRNITDAIIEYFRNYNISLSKIYDLEEWLQGRENMEIISTYANLYRRVVYEKEEKALYELPKEQREFFEREILRREIE